MKPSRLEMVAFGPYAGRQVIDFRELGAQTLFLICGPTGAGKTAVLDAMSFALFGQASGTERAERKVRSDHAPVDLPTEICFDFALKEQGFRIVRTPAQPRPKKRGDGTTLQAATATLWARPLDAPETDHGEVVAEGVSDVTQAVEERLGFGAAQFRQVVLIPQGEFRRLLSPDSTQRQAVLETLFQTKRYQRLELALKERVAAIRSQLQDMDVQRQTLLDQAEVDSVAAIQVKQDGLQERLETLQSQTEAHRAAQRVAQEAHLAGQRIEALLTEHTEAQAALTKLQAHTAQMDLHAADLQRARRAQTLADTERLLQDRRQAHDTATRALELASAQKQVAQQAHSDAQAQLAAAEGQAEQRTEAVRRVEQLTTLTEQATALEAARHAANTAAQMAGAHVRTARQARDQIAAAVTRSTAQQAECQATLTAQTAVLEEARAALSTAEQARDHAHAARLARQLQPDEPCPVCGSDSHPAPAQDPQDDNGPDSVEQARSRRDAAEAALSQAQRRSQDTDRRHVELCAEQTLAERTLRNLSPELLAALPQQGNTEATGELSTAIQEHIAAAKALEIHLSAVPEALRGPGAIARALQQAQATRDRLHRALEHARTQAQQTHADLAAHTARATSAQQALDQATTRQTEARAELDKRITEAGFADHKDFMSARRTDADIRTLDARLQQWRETCARTEERVDQATRAIQGIERPNMAVLLQQLQQADAQLSQHTAQVGATTSELQAIGRIQAQLAAIAQQFGDAEQSLQTAGRLADVATGKNPWRMTFERYVQAALLDEVLEAANLRLSPMTQQRYQLRRAVDPSDRRRKGGLDLEIIDAYTGRARPVSTLSGGEGFQTSLSLALGLADTVQARSGGVALDAIFVDEGFGSLGEADLDAVIEALQDLQAGHRLVGIISHVQELKQRIDTQLVVHKGRAGSSARFHVA